MHGLIAMGGFVDCAFAMATGTSPRRVAIEKAQQELRQEYDVCEERRRELKFLENGGNPLDFKVGNVASSIQPTSLTNQHLGKTVESEVKKTFCSCCSPHGYSGKSSGRSGGLVGCETSTADNLLPIDGGNSNTGGSMKSRHQGKKSNHRARLVQSLQVDSCHNAKELDDTLNFRSGVTSQAYARRKRSMSLRESANASSRQSSVTPSSSPDPKAAGLIREAQVECRAASSISQLKAACPNGDVLLKSVASDDKLVLELGKVQLHGDDATANMDDLEKVVTRCKTAETLPDIDDSNQQSHMVSVMVIEGTASEAADDTEDSFPPGLERMRYTRITEELNHLPSDKRIPNLHDNTALDKQAAIPEASDDGDDSVPPVFERIRDTSITEELNCLPSNKSIINLHDNAADLDKQTAIPEVAATEAANLNDEKPDLPCAEMSNNIDGHADGDSILMSTKAGCRSNIDSKEQQTFVVVLKSPDNCDSQGNGMLKTVIGPNIFKDICNYGQSNHSNSVLQVKGEVEVCHSIGDAQSQTVQFTSICSEKMKSKDDISLEMVNKCIGVFSSSDKSDLIRKLFVSSTDEMPDTEPTMISSTSIPEFENPEGNQSKFAKKEYEDSILKKAQIIEANFKRNGELSSCNLSVEKRQKCHWDFVLEEMAWMANDFMQERLWKSTTAAQLCHLIASGSRAKSERVRMQRKQKNVARTLAKAIMHFWHLADTLRTSGKAPGVMHDCYSNMLSQQLNMAEAGREQDSKYMEEGNSGLVPQLSVMDYALRFLESNCTATSDCPISAEAPTIPGRMSDAGSWEITDQLSGESLCYVVPPGAMEAYRESVEAQWVNYQKICNSVQQGDCETCKCDSFADGLWENADEDEETCSDYTPGTHKTVHKKKKHMQHKKRGRRVYNLGADISCEPCLDSKPRNQASLSNGKRYSSSLNVRKIPAKRARTDARPQVPSPSSDVVTICLQMTRNANVASGETNLHEDGHSSLHRGSLLKKNMEAESGVDYGRQLLCNGTELCAKSQDEESKHLEYKNSLNLTDSSIFRKDSSYEQRSETDPVVQDKQNACLKRKLDSQQCESNGNSVIYAQHATKKLKLFNQVPDISQKTLSPVIGPSPNPLPMVSTLKPNELMKLIIKQGRGRKSKSLKMGAAHLDPGDPQLCFEDQILVVLVHDMGKNWELISDLINGNFQFKGIFRKPEECKQRHKLIMDESAGDGNDSTEDSGSSQPYRSSLSGIPQGYAGQLFEHIQRPFEEGTLKAHFEKVILLRQQQRHPNLIQNTDEELKHIAPAHSSHMVALSQVYPNNLAGNFLTPDVLSHGYESPHSNRIAMPNRPGLLAALFTTPDVSSTLHESPVMSLGSTIPSSPTAPLDAMTTRGTQGYCVPRATSFQSDEHQRIQQHSQMLLDTNVQQCSMSGPGALPDCGVHVLPAANGAEMLCGPNQGMPMHGPGFLKLSPPGMLNLASAVKLLPTSAQGMQGAVNIHPSTVSSPANSMLSPCDPLHVLQPGLNLENHRNLIMQEIQMQISQESDQAVHFGSSAPVDNATASPVQLYTGQRPHQPAQVQQQQHIVGSPNQTRVHGQTHSLPLQQDLAFRLATERQMQRQRMLLSQKQNASLSMQNYSQIQNQTEPSQVNLGPSSQQHKRKCSTPNADHVINPQQQRQIRQQQYKKNQRQRSQCNQQVKHTKNLNGGNILTPRNRNVDASQVKKSSATFENPGLQRSLMQHDQGLFTGRTSRPSVPRHGYQSRTYSPTLQEASSQMSSLPSHSGIPNQGLARGSQSHRLLASQQPPIPSFSQLSSQQQLLHMNSSQLNRQRVMTQQNHQTYSEGRISATADQSPLQSDDSARFWSTDLSGSQVSSYHQHMQERSHDTSKTASAAQLERQDLMQRQMSGVIPLQGHTISGHWQLEQSERQRQRPLQRRQRLVVQGNV